MVTRLLKHSLLFSIMLSLNACSDDDGIDIIDIKVPEGYALVRSMRVSPVAAAT